MSDGSGMFGFIDKMYFKPTEKGWLFKEPSIWPRRTYLVTDAQKMRLAKPVRWMNLVMLIVVIAAIEMQGLVSDRLHLSFWLGMALVTVSALVVFWIYVTLFVRPNLSGLMQTDERITFSDQFRMQATMLPKPLMLVWLVICLAFVAIGLWLSFIEGLDLKGAAAIGFFAIIGAYPAALLVVRNRRSKALKH
jgi:hypothetical protein